MTAIKYFILTGEPGVGKTTLTKKLNSLLTGKGIKTTGFYTEEVRQHRTREGFDIITIDGQKGRLARDVNLLSGPIKYKVGKYGVLVNEFEKVALPALGQQGDTVPQLLIIDEIGKMEFFSGPFKDRVRDIFSPDSNCIVLATIPLRKGDNLIESIRNNTYSKVWMVTRENRDYIHEDVLREMQAPLKLSLL